MTANNLLDDLGGMLLAGTIEVVDLTCILGPDTPIFQKSTDPAKAAPKIEINKISEYDADGPFFAWNWMVLSEHSGTHFVAPHHWTTGKDHTDGYTDGIPEQNFVAPMNVIDCSDQVAKNPDYLLSEKAVKIWEREHGEIHQGDWVVMRSDWDRYSNDPANFLNISETGAHFPSPSVDCIEYILSKGAVGWGSQCGSTDAGQANKMTPQFPAHSLMHRSNRYGLAGLVNLDKLPAKGAILIAAPLKIENGTGSPVRALALIPKG
ncbi:MAG: kynurenine formamidase [Paracoccaceae bacterium]|jgi:kynurenine formamidase